MFLFNRGNNSTIRQFNNNNLTIRQLNNSAVKQSSNSPLSTVICQLSSLPPLSTLHYQLSTINCEPSPCISIIHHTSAIIHPPSYIIHRHHTSAIIHPIICHLPAIIHHTSAIIHPIIYQLPPVALYFHHTSYIRHHTSGRGQENVRSA
jgi:hypothetical protein